ncbi:arabinose ABC transporter permease [Comamonas serinivorans]|uniref:Arabinose ABC transporter permease n=1 Tax=Comamonas serinivorans TaxID=1082851 RepID=A0A1Y0EJ82_9BURK|nr:arabinose ABC transporter permease [Comamonas serinivorans]
MPDTQAPTPRPAPVAPTEDKRAWGPIRIPMFRMLWTTWLVANICMWMNDVAAAWLMTSLTSKPIWVALVQTASTLPMFLLGLPSGALADMLNRKHYFLFTQVWVAVVGVCLAVVVGVGWASPMVLLMLTFANGIGLAMRWPVFSAVVPELVPRTSLPAAMALNGVATNASRIVGPLLAGALIASLGSEWVFALNAVLSIAAAVVLLRWPYVYTPSPLGREPLVGAMRVGLQYVSQSRHLKGVLLRTASFFFCSTGLLALLPLVAKGLHGGNANTFTILLAAMGAGAIFITLYLPRIRQRLSGDRLLLAGTAVLAVAMLTVAAARNVWLATPAMLLAGAAWIATANAMAVQMQIGLPDWVRARGMSMFQMAIMGASALGAAVWGQVATWSDVPTSVAVAAIAVIVTLFCATRVAPEQGMLDDLTPAAHYPTADSVVEPPTRGHVIAMVDFQIDPAHAAEFLRLMEESRASRLRHGAVSWRLMHDVTNPGRFVEVIEDASWADHLRRGTRVTASDVALRNKKLAFHILPEPPLVSRFVVEPPGRHA